MRSLRPFFLVTALAAGLACNRGDKPQDQATTAAVATREASAGASAPPVVDTPPPLLGTPAVANPVAAATNPNDPNAPIDPNLPTMPIVPAPNITRGEQLMPSDAALVAHVDVRGLAASPLWASSRAALAADPEFTQQMTALKLCNTPFESLHSLDIGVNHDGTAVAVAIRGDGIGVPANLRCLHARLAGPAGAWQLVEDAGALRLVERNGGGFGHVVTPDLIVMTTTPWHTAVVGLIAGTGSAARDGRLKDVLTGIDAQTTIWFAGIMPPQLAAVAGASIGLATVTNLQTIAGALDLREGIALSLSLGHTNDAHARDTLTELRHQFTLVKPMAGMLGIPTAPLDSVTFTAQGPTVTITAALTMPDVEAISTTLNMLSTPTTPELPQDSQDSTDPALQDPPPGDLLDTPDNAPTTATTPPGPPPHLPSLADPEPEAPEAL